MATKHTIEAWVEPVPGVKRKGAISLSEAAHFGLEGAVQEITKAGAINPDASHVKITGPEKDSYEVTLEPPSRTGQVLVVEAVAIKINCSVELSASNIIGLSEGGAKKVLFTETGNLLVLASTGATWAVLKEIGVSFPTTAAVQEITKAGAINPDASHVKITGPAEDSYEVTLEPPSRTGQVLVVEAVAIGDDCSVKLIASNIIGLSDAAAGEVLFTETGNILVLASTGTAWAAMKEIGISFPTVAS